MSNYRINEKFEDLETAIKVDPGKQLGSSEYVWVDESDRAGLRVMFVGNSITLHSKLPEIGWNGQWGMAASAAEKDYVHLCRAHIRSQFPDASFCICQAAEWELAYKTGEKLLSKYERARRFDANLIIVKLCANSPTQDFNKAVFSRNYEAMMSYLNPSGHASWIVCTEFYTHPAEPCIREFAQRHGYPLCSLSDLGGQDCMKALGIFAHKGVANHPNDLGMAAIASRINTVFDLHVNEYLQCCQNDVGRK